MERRKTKAIVSPTPYFARFLRISSSFFLFFFKLHQRGKSSSGRLLGSRCAARGVGCLQSPTRADVGRPFGSCPSLERLSRSLSLCCLLCLQASSGPSGSPSTLAPWALRGVLGHREQSNSLRYWSRPRLEGLQAFPPPFSLPSSSLFSPPFFFSPLPSPPRPLMLSGLGEIALWQHEGRQERIAPAQEDSSALKNLLLSWTRF